MRKIFLATVTVMCLAATMVFAAPNRNNSGICSYSPLQDLIRNARSGKDLEPILGGRVDLNTPVKCGGTILQLAIRRGNPEVVKLLLENGVSAKENVSLEGFDIPGAPDNVPLLMFAAYYSPRQDILNLVISAGADMMVLDSNGENVLWYLSKNPVLQNTAISDSIKNILLFNIQPQATNQNNNVGASPIQPAAVMGAKNGQLAPVAQPAAQMIISKQPDGSIGVPNDVLKAIAAEGSAVQVPIQRPTEIVEPSMPIQ
jgi:hypothetical protein